MPSPWTAEQEKANRRARSALPRRRYTGGGTAADTPPSPPPSDNPLPDGSAFDQEAADKANDEDEVARVKENEVEMLLSNAIPNPDRDSMFDALDTASGVEGFDSMSAKDQADLILAAYARSMAGKANQRGMRK